MTLIQSDVDNLVNWTQSNKMHFNTDKCKFIYLGTRNAGHAYRIGGCILESTDSEKDLGLIVDKQLNMISQCDIVTKRVNAILRWINKGISREVILYCVQV